MLVYYYYYHYYSYHIPDLPDDIFLCKPYYGADELLCSTDNSFYSVRNYTTAKPVVERIKSNDDPDCTCNSQNSLLDGFCFSGISDFKILSNGKILVIHSAENCIRELDIKKKEVTPIGGKCRLDCNRKECYNDAALSAALFDRPYSFADRSNDSSYYILDNNGIRKVFNESVTTLTSLGPSRRLPSRPYSIVSLNESLKVITSIGLCTINITSTNSTCISINDIKTDYNFRKEIFFAASRDRKVAVLYEKRSSNPLRFALTDDGYFRLSDPGM